MTLTPETQRCLHRGRALFNQGRHWDAHEAWEDAWQVEEGEVKLFLQGLIQAAAALHKALVQFQPGPCVRLFDSALEKLEPLPAGMGGVDLERFRSEARQARAWAQRWSRGE